MAELCRRPNEVTAVVLSLSGLYREELRMIPAIRRASPRVEVWLTEIDGRPAALAEAMRLGADGLLGAEGLHRLSTNDGSTDRPAANQSNELRLAAVEPESSSASESPVRRVSENSEQSDALVETPVPVAVSELTTSKSDRRNGSHRKNGRAEAVHLPPAAELASFSSDDPLLTADELRALLHDPSGNGFGG